jgi:hypothetical protein
MLDNAMKDARRHHRHQVLKIAFVRKREVRSCQLAITGTNMRMVEIAEWDLSGMLDRVRAHRLLNPPAAEELMEIVRREAAMANPQRDEFCTLRPGTSMAGCQRAIAVIQVSAETFDSLFNGRSGYRAQYYLSEEEGICFNRMLIDALIEPLRAVFHAGDVEVRSFSGPGSKIWVHGDSVPFREAAHGEFLPRRWATERPSSSLALRAPLPPFTAIELKGAWLSRADNSYRIDPDKADRDFDLSDRGFV